MPAKMPGKPIACRRAWDFDVTTSQVYASNQTLGTERQRAGQRATGRWSWLGPAPWGTGWAGSWSVPGAWETSTLGDEHGQIGDCSWRHCIPNLPVLVSQSFPKFRFFNSPKMFQFAIFDIYELSILISRFPS